MMFNSNRSYGKKLDQMKKLTGGDTTQSMFSIKSTISFSKQHTSVSKETIIAKKINDHFKEREKVKTDKIRQTIFDDHLKIYKQIKKEFEERLQDLVKERAKINRRKKANREKQKLLMHNTRERIWVISKILKRTYKYYENLYTESDNVRMLKLQEAKYFAELEKEAKEREQLRPVSTKMSSKQFITQMRKEQELQQLYESVISKDPASASPTKDRTPQMNSFSDVVKQAVSLAKKEKEPTGKDSAEGGTSASKAKEKDPPKIKRNESKSFDQQSMMSKSSRYSKMSRARMARRFMKKESSQEYEIQMASKISKFMMNPTIQGSNSALMTQLIKFMSSPFKEDRRFAIKQTLLMSRSQLDGNVENLDRIFYDKIVKLMLDPVDEVTTLQALEIMGHIMDSEFHRKKLSEKKYMKLIFKKMEKVIDDSCFDSTDPSLLMRSGQKHEPMQPTKKMSKKTVGWFESMSYIFKLNVVKRLSWIASIMAYYNKDFAKDIIEMGLVPLTIKMTNVKFPDIIRQNAVLGLSLFSQNDDIFDHMLELNTIEKVLDICMDPLQDHVVKQYSTLSVVHFALNKKSINPLIEKGVMKLFDTFKQDSRLDDNQILTHRSIETHSEMSDSSKNLSDLPTPVAAEELKKIQRQMLQTNVSWIFMALSNNGIPGYEMLKRGITRDMFLVACNPQYQIIRYLVITSFAVLGTSTERTIEPPSEEKLRIKELATSSQHEIFKGYMTNIIDILLSFAVSDNVKVQQSAYTSLQEFLMSCHKRLPKDISNIINAFLVGSIAQDHNIQTECSNAMSFLVTHGLVYKQLELEETYDKTSREERRNLEFKCIQLMNQPAENVMDAIMNLSGSDNNYIRATAFSTLSSLAQYSSKYKSVMCQVRRDIEFPIEESVSGSEDSQLKSIDSSLTKTTVSCDLNYMEFVEKRLEKLRSEFTAQFKREGVELLFSGFFSLQKLAQSPTDEVIDMAISAYTRFIGFAQSIQERVHQFVEQGNQDDSQQSVSESLSSGPKGPNRGTIALTDAEAERLERLQENEVYFIEVFQALRRCDSPQLICNLMKIVFFYSKQNDYRKFLSAKVFRKERKSTTHQGDCRCLQCISQKSKLLCLSRIINPEIVLWILEILEKQSKGLHNKYLSCICSMTLLNIVDKDDIAIGHQEQAIIKLFNKVLQNIEVFSVTSSSSKSAFSQDHHDPLTSLSFSPNRRSSLALSRLRSAQQRREKSPSVDEESFIESSSIMSSSELESSEPEEPPVVPTQSSDTQAIGNLRTQISTSQNARSIDNLGTQPTIESFDQRGTIVQTEEDLGHHTITEPQRESQFEVSRPNVHTSQPSSSKRTMDQAIVFQHVQQEPVTLESLMDQQREEEEKSFAYHTPGPATSQRPSLSNFFPNRKPISQTYNHTSPPRSLEKIEEHDQEYRDYSGMISEKVSLLEESKEHKSSSQTESLITESLTESPAQVVTFNIQDRTEEGLTKMDSKKPRTSTTSNAHRRKSKLFPERSSLKRSSSQFLRQESKGHRSISNKNLRALGFESRNSVDWVDEDFTGITPVENQYALKKKYTIQGRSMKMVTKEFPVSRPNANLDEDFSHISQIMDGIFDLRDSNMGNQSMLERELVQEKNIDLYLRDSLIKTFMIIFTNEQSQHLLLNYDLIDIAFNCMQSSQDIALETQRNVARLASMILKFPKVQVKLMNPLNNDVIIGMANLLSILGQNDLQFQRFVDHFASQPDAFNPQGKKVTQYRMKIHTIRYMLEACSLVSFNRKFIQNEEQCQRVLDAVIQIMKCPHVLVCLELFDFFNIVGILKNIIKPSDAHAQTFFVSRKDRDIISILTNGLDNYALSCLKKDKKQKVVRQGLLDLFKNSDGSVPEDDVTNDIEQEADKISNQTRTSETFLGVSFHSHIQGFSLQILESLVNNEKYLVRILNSGDTFKLIRNILRVYWDQTDDWCLFRTQFQQKPKYVEFLNLAPNNTALLAQLDKKKVIRVPKLNFRRISISSVKPISQASPATVSHGITEMDEESSQSSNLSPMISPKNLLVPMKSSKTLGGRKSVLNSGQKKQSVLCTSSKGSSRIFWHHPGSPTTTKGGSEEQGGEAENEMVDLVEVENVEQQERREVMKKLRGYKLKIEMRYYLFKIITRLLKKPCMNHREEDCGIKNLLYRDINIVENLVIDMHILAIKLNELEQLKKERQEKDLNQIYDRCFNLMKKGKEGRHDVIMSPTRSNTAVLVETQELLNKLTESETEEDIALNDDQVEQFEIYYNQLFRSMVWMFRAFNIKREAIFELVQKEEYRRGLISFIENINDRQKKFTIFYVISSMLIELLQDPQIQSVLVEMRFRKKRLVEVDNEAFLKTLQLVSATVERLFGMAAKLDEQHELEQMHSDEPSKDKREFKQEVVWLIEQLKIEVYLRQKQELYAL